MKDFRVAVSGHFRSNKWFYLLIGLLIASNAFFFLSKRAAGRHHAVELSDTRQYYEQQTRLIVAKQAEEQLTLMQKTFVWAVRSALIRDNLDEVNQYFNELIKEEGMKEIVLADAQGQIAVSTNKKNEGRPFADLFSAPLLQVEKVTFNQDNETYQVVAPVLSLNARLGTLLIHYQADSLVLNAGPATQ